MAVYEANIRSLAEFISDTKFGFMPENVESDIGYRVNKTGNRYKIAAYEIKCDRIYVTNDCFIDVDGNIVVTSYIPSFRYALRTNELSGYYSKDTHLHFEFYADSQVVTNSIRSNVILESYDDFKKCLNEVMESIEYCLKCAINDFRPYQSEWRIEDVVCDIEWQVDKIKSK